MGLKFSRIGLECSGEVGKVAEKLAVPIIVRKVLVKG